MAHAPHSTMPPESAAKQREDSDVNVRAILGFGAGLIVTALAIHLMVWLLFQYFNGREAARVVPEYPLAIGEATRLPPEPRLQTNPRGDLRALRTHEDDLLNNYGWVDKPAGIVRIPIEEAMRITLQRGLPARPSTGDTKK
jgi:hypothetical protein